MADNTNINIVLSKNGDKFSLFILPKANVKDESVNNIKPIIITGDISSDTNVDTIMELITVPIESANKLFSNIIEFENSVSKAEKNTKAVKEKDSKFDKLVNEAEKLEKQNKLDLAIKTYKEALSIKQDNKVSKKIQELTAKNNQGTLFGEPEPIIEDSVEETFDENDDEPFDDDEDDNELFKEEE